MNIGNKKPMDVYEGEMPAQKNFGKRHLFIFFD